MMSNQLPIRIPHEAIRDFCQRHHILSFSLFGSVLRDDFGPDSDINVLVEFEEGTTPGLAFSGMQDELAAVMGRRVDLTTTNGLSEDSRDEVLAEAALVYLAE